MTIHNQKFSKLVSFLFFFFIYLLAPSLNWEDKFRIVEQFR